MARILLTMSAKIQKKEKKNSPKNLLDMINHISKIVNFALIHTKEVTVLLMERNAGTA